MKVSIIIPVYKVEQYIEDCLISVANQTVTDDIECIIVDDCGGDRSIDIAESFIQSYNGNLVFSIIRRKENGGLSEARNTGISASKGKYLYFLDSDDEIIPSCLESLLKCVEKHQDVDLVQGSFFRNENESRVSNTFPFDYTYDRKYIKQTLLTFDGDLIKAQNRLVKKTLITDNNLYFKPGIIHEDNHWTFFLAKHVKSMGFCNNRTYFHRYNPLSITGNRNIKKEIFAYRTLIKEFCSNIDSFLYGRQKELILETLLYVKKNHLFDTDEDYSVLVDLILQHNNFIERNLYKLMDSLNGKIKIYVLHLLIRLYKIHD